MRRKKTRLKYKKERALLSDVLPYELPLTFSNRSFYKFLVENGIEYRGGRIHWKKDDGATDDIIRLLFGAKESARVHNTTRNLLGNTVVESYLKVPEDGYTCVGWSDTT